jgi:hypothetical protein
VYVGFEIDRSPAAFGKAARVSGGLDFSVRRSFTSGFVCQNINQTIQTAAKMETAVATHFKILKVP